MSIGDRLKALIIQRDQAIKTMASIQQQTYWATQVANTQNLQRAAMQNAPHQANTFTATQALTNTFKPGMANNDINLGYYRPRFDPMWRLEYEAEREAASYARMVEET